MSEFTLSVPDGFIDAIAARVAELLPTDVAASPWLDVPGACAYLGLSKDALYKLTARKPPAIPLHRVGSRIWFKRDELDAWLDEHYEGPPQTAPRLRVAG